MSAKEHELKCWPEYFTALVDGTKTFEYRRNDRGFRVGDVLHLREWDSITGHYTGREMRRHVTYVLPTDISGDFVVMALDASREAHGSPLVAIDTLVRDYHNDKTTLTAAETLAAIAKELGGERNIAGVMFTDVELQQAGQDWGKR